VELKAPSWTDYWWWMANIATGEKTYLTYFGNILLISMLLL